MAASIDQFSDNPLYIKLPAPQKQALENLCREYRLSFQQLRTLLIITSDLEMWKIGPLTAWIDELPDMERRSGKQRAAALMRELERRWQREKELGGSYENLRPSPHSSGGSSPGQTLIERPAPETILGSCPVASEKTRCCNLMTLDAVVNCGYGCAYCTIQSFYDEGRIFFHQDLAQKLQGLRLDPDTIYHIGTGQSSDSLMWGNRGGLLELLFDFAEANPNVILELKTKSANIAYILERKPPRNLLITWSLNSEAIADHEERGTASVPERLDAARRVAEKGCLIGFHFHPMVPHQGWKKAYGRTFDRLVRDFTPERVAMVSFGTLTYIKPVIRAIRERGEETQVLRMPLVESAGKYSYPDEIKLELFRFAYNRLCPWHGKTFFYLCMEPAHFWEPVFGYSYPDNASFEEAMKRAYLHKIG